MQVSLFFKRKSHINQYIYGFMMLHKKGILQINSIKESQHCNDNILRASINGLKLVYDGSDGDQVDRGFLSFSDYEWCDIYYKRSYSVTLGERYPKIKPVGFNYNIIPDYSKIDYVKKSAKKILGKEIIRHHDLESLPVALSRPRILFLTGLWDPCEDLSIADEIEKITKTRLAILDTLSKEFKEMSTFGVNETTFTKKIAKKYVLPRKKTNKMNFIKMLKNHDICITSAGMHYSSGWRLGEYIAASRSIISEDPYYETVGDFKKNENYRSFACGESLIDAINHLLDRKKRQQMMLKNYTYYHQYLRPDSLILNSIVNAR
ncbi:hypothetical protein C9426_12600 [Serratia sp. S1B]|nr:hypothetical protein C9426_12600 [Serratia sp. S1B]